MLIIKCRRLLSNWYPEWHSYYYRNGLLHTQQGTYPVYICIIKTKSCQEIPKLSVKNHLVALFYHFHGILVPCKHRWLIPAKHWGVRNLLCPFPPLVEPYIPECLNNSPHLQHNWEVGFP